jgi:isoquinoline 1-oxidoreductase beta subunit
MVVPQCEMGQGVTTLLPQIMADELGADWRTIAVETAPINPLYTNTLLVDEDSAVLHTAQRASPISSSDVRSWARREWAVRHAVMLTANSSSVRMFEGPCRAAAAQARALLMMAAARRWDADWEQCDTQDGFVTLRQEETCASARSPPRRRCSIRPPSRCSGRRSADPLYGKELTRLDLPAKVDGSANYAGDIRLPDMVFAAIRQGPLGATRLKGIDRKKAGIAIARAAARRRRTSAGSLTVARNWWAANARARPLRAGVRDRRRARSRRTGSTGR